MLNHLSQVLNQLGTRIQNYGYLIANPSYSKVRKEKGCPDLYRLLNKAWFPKEDIQLVLDVGANEGRFIKTSLALMPGVPVYAFEPNSNSIQVIRNQEWGVEKVTVFPVALGSHKETRSLNVSKFSPASSFLKNSDQLINEFPDTVTETTIVVDVERLDTLIQRSGAKELNFLLKIDVQGFELEVLKGATDLFDQILVIVCEVNIALLYEQQCALESVLAFLQNKNYQLIDIGNPVRSRTEELLYLDLAFIRKT